MAVRVSKKLGSWASLSSRTRRSAGVVDAGSSGGEVVVGDFGAVDADALIGADEMGRGIEAGAEAGGVRGWRPA